jgi:DNA (cytosine-5)-methyltransferase 1
LWWSYLKVSKKQVLKLQVAVDKEETFLKTFSHNFKNSNTKNLDLGNEKVLEQIPKADIIIAGPPCQGFSLTGPRNIDDPRNKLYLSVFKTLKKINQSFCC